MKIKELKEIIEGLPDDLEIYFQSDNTLELEDIDDYEIVFKRNLNVQNKV